MSAVTTQHLNEVATVETVGRVALQAYYDMLDTPEKRTQLLQRYVPRTDGPLMSWNGHQLATVSDIANYFNTLPRTRHAPLVIDVQPLPLCTKGDRLIATAIGTVTYDAQHSRHYYHRVVFAHDGTTRIVQDYMRWTGEIF